jgi:hypothetical protein
MADCAPPLAFFSAFGFTGLASGLAATARLWMRSQIRLAAELVDLKRFTGSTPGRPFQIATSRSALPVFRNLRNVLDANVGPIQASSQFPR